MVNFLKRLSLAQRFMLASLIILVSGMFGIGQWIGQEIEAGVIHRTAATTALFVDSFVAPNLQELSGADVLSAEHIGALGRLLQHTPLGQHIAAFKVWNAGGRVLYSSNPASIGQVFSMNDSLARAWRGEVSARISDLEDAENLAERERDTRLLETYSPVRAVGTGQIIAVAEFYQTVDDLRTEVAAAQQRSWLVVAIATLVMYVLLYGFVRRASETIVRQQTELRTRVAQLTDLLAQNVTLHERVQRAAARTAALNERFLRRISAELHDGPAQDLALALLRFDLLEAGEQSRASGAMPTALNADPTGQAAGCYGPAPVTQRDAGFGGAISAEAIRSQVQLALQEVRAISTGLGLPQLSESTLAETLTRAIRAHERKTGTRVITSIRHVPAHTPLPLKITLYRVVQEALSNAYRHASGKGQQVQLDASDDRLTVEISDEGPGLDGVLAAGRDERLGLVGMRERVESLGGVFAIDSRPGQGTRIIAHLSIHAGEGNRD